MAIDNSLIFTQWVENYSDALYGWAFFCLNDHAAAEDIVQETFLTAFKKYPQFQQKSQVKTWITGILNIKLKEYYRKKEQQISWDSLTNMDDYFNEDASWKPETASKIINFNEEINHIDDLHIYLMDCMKKLPEFSRTLLVLKFWENKKANQICQEFDISLTNYWQIVHRSKTQLRLCIEKMNKI